MPLLPDAILVGGVFFFFFFQMYADGDRSVFTCFGKRIRRRRTKEAFFFKLADARVALRYTFIGCNFRVSRKEGKRSFALL